MIIIIGPDHSGKTTLAEVLEKQGYKRFHFTKDSRYEDYLGLLCRLELWDAVLDRYALCEYSYAKVMGRKFAFSMKQWHNLILLALIQNPLVVLCVNKPPPNVYSANQYLPYGEWDRCLELYISFLSSHCIPYIDYDYKSSVSVEALIAFEKELRLKTAWWVPMWTKGYGCIGSPSPKVLLVAERIGPNNVNCIPFETGPTGRMLSSLLEQTRFPLGKFTVTNLVKAPRRDPRPPNDRDLELFAEELVHLRPEKVVFMGSPAKQGVPVVEELGIPYDGVVHLGYFHHKTGAEWIPPEYLSAWEKIMGVTPEPKYKLQEEWHEKGTNG